MTPLSAWQKSVVWTAWFTYAGYYLGRVNFSPAIPALVVAFGVSRAEIGGVATALFWTYSVGQYLSGEVGNRANARLLVTSGLLISALCNLGMALQTSVPAMMFLWGVNGVAQSMGWSPLLRVLADTLDADQRRRVSAWFPLSYQAGTAITWAMTGGAIAVAGWRAAFWLPCLLLGVITAVWWFSGVDAMPATLHKKESLLRDSLTEARLMLPVTLASACIGFVSSGSIIWLPTYVADTRIIPANFAGAVAGLVPLLGGAGVLLSHWLVRRVRLITHVVMLMLALTIAALCLAAALPVPAQAWALALAMVLVSGATGITLSAIPVMTAQAGRTSSAAGSLSAANSVGGGLAGVIVGLVVQGTGWAAVFVAWAFGLALAMGFIYWYGRSMAAAPAH